MSATEATQLELLPVEVPRVRRARLHLADLTGFEHARPDRELVELIGRLGLLQPVVVAGAPQQGYSVLEGRRRAKAVQLLSDEGEWPSPPKVDALILTGGESYGEDLRAGIALALHAVRSPSPASELAAIEAILQSGGDETATVKRIAEETGMPQQTVRRRLKLRNLSPALRAAFDGGELVPTVAEAAARLSAEQQAHLERLLGEGERVTLGAVREVARKRTVEAAVALDAGLFGERRTPWRTTVRGHLLAALEAIPPEERGGALDQAIGSALVCAEDAKREETRR